MTSPAQDDERSILVGLGLPLQEADLDTRQPSGHSGSAPKKKLSEHEPLPGGTNVASSCSPFVQP